MNTEQLNLMAKAKDAAKKAYAPYSKFRVGAAVYTDSGIYIGANIENASSNLGICAERVAISHAKMHGYKKIIGIAVYCFDAPLDKNGNIDPRQTMPCGGCRQWLAELAPEAWLITNGSERIFTLEDLLPDSFSYPL